MSKTHRIYNLFWFINLFILILSGCDGELKTEHDMNLNASCASDFEFYRASNETLFDMIYTAPELFLKVLQYGDLKNHDVIMEELGSPAHAGIDVEIVRNKIKKQDEKYMFKYDVLSALD